MKRESLRIYLCLSLERGMQGMNCLEILERAIAGGVTAVQLREKQAPLLQVLAVGRRMREICRERGVLFLVNDRVDVAMALQADGVHLGQTDFPPEEARKLLGPDSVIGVSASSLAEAQRGVEGGADYLGAGSIYATKSKADAGEPVGVGLIRQIRQRFSLPIVGIGGITAENAAEVLASGADGVAVISAISHPPDPQQAAQQLQEAVRKGLQQRD